MVLGSADFGYRMHLGSIGFISYGFGFGVQAQCGLRGRLHPRVGRHHLEGKGP